MRSNVVRYAVGLAALIVLVRAVAACGAPPQTAAPAGQSQAGAPAGQAQAPAQQPAKAAADFTAVAKGTDKLFVAADDVKKAYDAKQDFLIIDARPGSDFAAGHIDGASNIPYFDMAKRYSEVPKDKWVITYCSCPHAEAEQAARELMKQGYTKVKVLDEGFCGWSDKKYPIVGKGC